MQHVPAGLAAQEGRILVRLRLERLARKLQIGSLADRGFHAALAQINDVARQLTVSAAALPRVVAGLRRRRIKMNCPDMVFAVADAAVQEDAAAQSGEFAARSAPLLCGSGIEHVLQASAIAERVVLKLRGRAFDLDLRQPSAGAEGLRSYGDHAARNCHLLQPAAVEGVMLNGGHAIGNGDGLQTLADRKRIGRQGFQPVGERDAF